MANPFGGSDEALSVNIDHIVNEYLVYAVIPRSANKFVEVVNGWEAAPSASGTYDADGYWYSGTTTRATVTFTLSSNFAVIATKTLIAGFYRDNAAGTQDFSTIVGLWRDSATPLAAFVNASSGLTVFPNSKSNDGAVGPTGSLTMTGISTFAAALKQDGLTPAQSGFVRVSGSNTYNTATAVTFSNGSNDQLNRIGVRTASKWRFQYLFVSNEVLDDGYINNIIEQVALGAGMPIVVGGGGGGGGQGPRSSNYSRFMGSN